MTTWRLLLFAWLLLCISVLSECPNGCSSHGKCGQYDMCLCHRNWMGEDCSQRMCQFGLAYVDSPKGDLDSSKGYLSGPDKTVAVNSYLYPEGTTEQYPQMITSSGDLLSNTAHEYRECSNAGYCNRESGECECFPGYEGSACQRLSCPTTIEGEECSGHGTCHSVAELAKKEAGNHYRLWDEDASMGCRCDGHYAGPACEQRLCKLGYDPMYPAVYGRRYHNVSYAIFTESPAARISGVYALRFFDALGEDWETDQIAYGADCATVIKALEALPNQVVPRGSVRCVQQRDLQAAGPADEPVLAGLATNPFHGIKYTLVFPENPGVLRPLEVNFFCDGPRATLSSDRPAAPARSFAYSAGFSGEAVDLFPHHCAGVTVTLAQDHDSARGVAYDFLAGLGALEARLLQRCLGDSDGDPDTVSATGSVYGGSYAWDYGSAYHPHLVKLVPVDLPAQRTDICDATSNNFRDTTAGGNTPASLCGYPRHRVAATAEEVEAGGGEEVVMVPGFFAAVVFDPDLQRFVLFSAPSRHYGATTQFHLFATSSVVQLVNPLVSVISDPLRPYSRSVFSVPTALLNTSSAAVGGVDYVSAEFQIYGNTTASGDLCCESADPEGPGVLTCLERGDRVVLLSPDLTPAAHTLGAAFLDIFTVARTGLLPVSELEARFGGLNISASARQALFRHEVVLDRGVAGLWTGYALAGASANSTGILGYGQAGAANIKAYKLVVSEGVDGAEGEAAPFAFASECSNRGNCDRSTGLCDCFAGFAGDSCSLFYNSEL